MIESRLHGLDPKKLRTILLIGIALIIVVTGVGFWFFRAGLAEYAQKVVIDRQTANTSSKDLSALQRLKTQLEEDSVAVNRAEKIVAETKYYKYQNQIIEDINTYAKASKITVQGYAFDAGSANTTTPATGATTAVPPVAVVAGAPKTTSVSVNIQSPVNYKAFLQFVHAIEINLTKMQLSGISISKPEDSNVNNVNVSPLTIEVYIQ